MQLQIELLRTFVAVANTGGFTRAGAQINRSQSAVSMQIKRLEETVTCFAHHLVQAFREKG